MVGKLKTNYQDAVWEGLRKYIEIRNNDGTVSFQDVTTYKVYEQSFFGAKDANDIGKAVNEIRQYHTIRRVTITANGWSNTYPYINSVTVPDMDGDTTVKVIGIHIPDGSTAAQIKAWNKAASFLIPNEDQNASGEGYVTFKAYQKPAIDFTVIIEGG